MNRLIHMSGMLQRTGWGLLLVVLVACGRSDTPQPAQGTPSTAVAATLVATIAPIEPSATPIPSANATAAPVPTFAQILVDISSPNAITPTVANAPVVVAPAPPTIAIQINDHALSVELASTPEQRQIGLMNRPSMSANNGMLFVFPADQQLSFWMRNTLIPLSIAFVDSNMRILNIEDMQALDEQNFHLSNGPARYALEVTLGWFATNNIKPGDTLIFALPSDLEIR